MTLLAVILLQSFSAGTATATARCVERACRHRRLCIWAKRPALPPTSASFATIMEVRGYDDDDDDDDNDDGDMTTSHPRHQEQ